MYHVYLGLELQTRAIRSFAKISHSRRRPLLGPSPGCNGILVLSHLRHYAKQTNLQMDLFQALVDTRTSVGCVDADGAVAAVLVSSALPLVTRVTLRRRLRGKDIVEPFLNVSFL